MVSDWLKTQKKPARTNQIRAVLTEKLKNKLIITDYAKVENIERKRWQPHANHISYTF